MTFRLAALAALVGLSACVPYADRVAATCERLGMGQGSDLYFSCIQDQEANDTANRAIGASMIGAGVQLMAPPPQPVFVMVR